MTKPHGSVSQNPDADVQSLYKIVSQNPRYAHYARIPERICRCLDYFKVIYERETVREQLHSYYLFIGVADDLIDSNGLPAGAEILKQLSDRATRFDEEKRRSPVKLVTEVLKSRISSEIYSTVVGRLEELYEAVVREQRSSTIDEYIRERKRVGYLTAEVSYLLIKPGLGNDSRALPSFFTKVGEVGCLVDSMIDLRADYREGIINFKPTAAAHLKLAGQTLYEGVRVLCKRPRLFNLFIEGISDDLRDRSRQWFVPRAARLPFVNVE
jgi:hypothetical protein